MAERAQGRRILVVEDEPVSAELVRILLEDLAAEVDLVTTGADAVSLARQTPFDLILMDLFLPVMSGLEAVAAIRADPGAASRDAPVIALTASASAADHKACLEAGMNDFLLKPLGRETLDAMLVKWRIVETSRLVDPPTKGVPPDGGFDPGRIAGLRGALEKPDFDAVLRQAAASLEEHLEIIGRATEPDDIRRALHRVVSVSHDLGFVSLGGHARALEKRLAEGRALEAPALAAFLDEGRVVLARLRSMAGTD